jgi:protein involved in polysaccharide export with SLBB domain
MTPFDSRRSFQTGIAFVATLVLSGCAMIDTAGDKSSSLPIDTQATATAATTITMEIRASGKKPEINPFQLDNGSTVQQMLEKAKLVKKFRRMDIEVVRTVGDQRARMDVKYDHTQAQVRPEYDYALHPGDHVIVQEVTKTAFDDMLESVADPLRRATGGR